MTDPKVLAQELVAAGWDNLRGDPSEDELDCIFWTAYTWARDILSEPDDWQRWIQQVIRDSRTPDEDGMIPFMGPEVIE